MTTHVKFNKLPAYLQEQVAAALEKAVKPLYNPECEDCIFLGSYRETDLYLDLHTMGGKGGLMAVCSNKDGDYHYMLLSDCRERMKWWKEEGKAQFGESSRYSSYRPEWPTNEAYRRAVTAGFIDP